MVREKAKIAKKVVSRSLMAYLNPGHKISEQFRSIRNNIQFASEGKAIRTIVVTSPAEGDGKSTAAVNLAISMAQRGEQVLLIDANFRSPMLHKLFNTQMSPGLSNLLANQLPFGEAAQQTEIECLDLITSGVLQTHSTDMLDSHRMKEILEAASSQYDRIVIDCPAVLAAPDTNALVNKCDGVVLLLRCGKTTHSKALEAKQSLAFAGANIVGAILNKKSVR
ncbi:CpsD/CapB family tyrosine-protein kinase [Paenibacillus sp. LHD-117]|uniref:CpsD/CapB family tyrosine-protein kinase n=1 Tax=Paenibacillus sp. LHD-117 TaxID=3071412 RepID=UPI0027DFF0C9|nr:CpsD/CapB family tyrosine-protein kinase [Paenibacillus sp. LHD-117]MDQ6423277.1 CpsD/CapB family tyrosine-protein kinase [Paenibacillus sp. LHD-117]